MRVPEWYWWLNALIGLAASAGIVVGPVVFLGNQLPLDVELGYTFTNDLLLAAAFGTVLLVFALMLVVTSIRARDRYHRRKLALAGNMDALPLSRIAPKLTDAPDLSSQPLVLMWSASRGMRRFEGPLRVLLVIAQATVPLFLLVFVGVAIILDPHKIVTATPTQILAIAGAIGVGVAVIVLLIIYSHAIPTLFGRPFGVTATSEGIECRTELGRHFLVPWAEMRLFEVEGSGSTGIGRRHFRVYGSRRIAEWHDNPLKYNEYAPHEIAPEEMAERLQAMINLIAARTGLAPRTLSKALWMPDVSATRDETREDTSRRVRGAVTALLIFGVLTLASACVVVLLPLTTSTALNLATAGSLAMLVVALAALRAYDWRLQLRVASDVPAPALPPDAPTGKYILLSGMAAPARSVFAVVGMALCVNFFPALALLANVMPAPVRMPLVWLPTVPTAAASALTWLLLLFGLFGGALLRASITGRATAIRASAAGLSMTIANRPITLLWEQVAAVTAHTRQGRVIRYAVADSGNKIRFSWPADPSRSLPPKSSDDALSITPGELAALASARSGKPIEERELCPACQPATR